MLAGTPSISIIYYKMLVYYKYVLFNTGKASNQLEGDVLLQLEAISKQSDLMRWVCLRGMFPGPKLLIFLYTVSRCQYGRRRGLETVFCHSWPLTCSLSALQFIIQSIQTLHHQSSDCCSSSQNACFKHRIISHQSCFTGKFCLILKADFFSFLGRRNPFLKS